MCLCYVFILSGFSAGVLIVPSFFEVKLFRKVGYFVLETLFYVASSPPFSLALLPYVDVLPAAGRPDSNQNGGLGTIAQIKSSGTIIKSFSSPEYYYDARCCRILLSILS